MDFTGLVVKNRSYRRFRQEVEVGYDLLRELVDLARLSPSAANRQPLRFIISNDPEKNNLIFPNLAWAGYLPDWDGPEEGERPSAYIVLLTDTNISKSIDCDHGIAAQSILLGAVSHELGGCMIAALKKEGLRAALKIPEDHEILLVVALGKPKEKVIVDKVGEDGDIKYWRDQDDAHHVPKRSLDELILNL